MAELRAAGQTAPLPRDSGMAAAVLDPYVNALHASLLRENRLNPVHARVLTEMGVGGPEVPRLRERLLPKARRKCSRARSCLSCPTPNRCPGKYVAIPDKRELGLGKPLVLDFVREFLPSDFDEVRYIFGKKGAYPKFRALLARKNAVDRWYDFEIESDRTCVARLVRAQFDRRRRLRSLGRPAHGRVVRLLRSPACDPLGPVASWPMEWRALRNSNPCYRRERAMS